MIDFDLEKEFTAVQQNLFISPHPLKQFFKMRRITNAMLSHVLETSHVQVSNWLSGKRNIPVKWLTDLEFIRDRLLAWEEEHGYKFNSELACPYAENGVRFGTDFDLYDVCEECKLRKECGCL